MTTSEKVAAHVHRIRNALDGVRRTNAPSPDALASALTGAVSELVQAITECAADMDAIARRVDALKTGDK